MQAGVAVESSRIGRTVFLRQQRGEAVAVGPEVLSQGLVGDAELVGVVGVGCPFAKQPHTVMRPLGLADARAMIEAALERRDQTDLDYEGDDALDHELRALVDQRVALLPDGGTRQPVSPTVPRLQGVQQRFNADATARPHSHVATCGNSSGFAGSFISMPSMLAPSTTSLAALLSLVVMLPSPSYQPTKLHSPLKL